MSYGLEVFSPFNSVLIDENVVCARRIAVHTISTAAPNGFGVCIGSLSVGGAAGNYVALTKDSRFHTVRLRLLAAGGYTIEVYVESGAATSVEVTVLGFTPPVASSEYGLEVFSPSGSRVFSSAENNIALLGDVDLLTYTSTAKTASIANPTARNLMIPFAYGILGFDVVPVNAGQSRLQTAFGRVASVSSIEYKVGALAIIGGGTGVGYENYLTTNALPIFLE